MVSVPVLISANAKGVRVRLKGARTGQVGGGRTRRFGVGRVGR